MVEVAPFNGLRYNEEQSGPLGVTTRINPARSPN